ncbi:YqcC family protein [Salinicola halimionae]|uniref:YqcC family protein n=1 Tax=Salinicola halimionae TaxID=1949081 RepID=UPI000DA13700|nr:YqcC family protein [Salinicola halimionae]
MTVHEELARGLRQLEVVLMSAGLWEEPLPAPSAFESHQPFCVDTMSMPQWLRYVFIARLQALVDARAPLPASCDVAPAMEVWLKDAPASQREPVIRQLAAVDRIVTRA